MKHQTLLPLRPSPLKTRGRFTDAIVLTLHTTPKPSRRMYATSPTTPTPSKSGRTFSPLPASVPTAPRAIFNDNPSIPTKETSPKRLVVPSLPHHASLTPRKQLHSNLQATERLTIVPFRERLILEPGAVELVTLKIRRKLSATVIEEPEVNLVTPAQLLLPLQLKTTCWACGKDGHDMMNCKNLCGHCAGIDHNSISCRYGTLSEGKHGKRVLDAEIWGTDSASKEVMSEHKAYGAPKQELAVDVQKYEKKSLEKSKRSTTVGFPKHPKGMKIPNGPKSCRQSTTENRRSRHSKHKTSNHERQNGPHGSIAVASPHLGVGKRGCRTRSYSPPRHGNRGHNEARDSSRKYRERDYHDGIFSPRWLKYERDNMLTERERTLPRLRMVNPEDNGKWRRETSRERDELKDPYLRAGGRENWPRKYERHRN
jgi:hypothetical protein